MNRALLIIYEPALFLLAALGWAGWELWSMRKGKSHKEKGPSASRRVRLQDQAGDAPSDPGPP